MADKIQTKITLDDLDKAANFYENLIDNAVLNPSAEKARVLWDAMKALDALAKIREDLRRGVEHVTNDGK